MDWHHWVFGVRNIGGAFLVKNEKWNQENYISKCYKNTEMTGVWSCLQTRVLVQKQTSAQLCSRRTTAWAIICVDLKFYYACRFNLFSVKNILWFIRIMFVSFPLQPNNGLVSQWYRFLCLPKPFPASASILHECFLKLTPSFIFVYLELTYPFASNCIFHYVLHLNSLILLAPSLTALSALLCSLFESEQD